MRVRLDQADAFKGVPRGTAKPLRFLAAFQEAEPYLGLPVHAYKLVAWLVKQTQLQDWEEGSRPIAWPSARHQAEFLGLSPARVKQLNHALFEAGIFVMRDNEQGKRYGRRDPETKRIIEAFGFDLSPLALRYEEFVRVAAAARVERERMRKLRRRATLARRAICQAGEELGTEDAPIVPAGPSGAPWRFATRQFRRTIAWHIANRPFGTIAGMIQYKHASVAAFEGYAGSSRSGFRAEVDAERRLGQMEDILTYFDDRRAGARLSGPAAARVGQALDAAADELQPLSGMIADRGRLRILLANTARTLHVGVLADCFFDPATAVCLRRATASDQTTPMISLCEPTRCPNACITQRHRPAWEQTADDARALLHEKRLSGLQRVALTQELHRIETILAAVKDQDSSVTAPSGQRVSSL